MPLETLPSNDAQPVAAQPFDATPPVVSPEWDGVTLESVLQAIPSAEYITSPTINAVPLIQKQLEKLAKVVWSLKDKPTAQKMIIIEGAARSGKTTLVDALCEILTETNVSSVYLTMHETSTPELQRAAFADRIAETQPKVIFIDEVMQLDSVVLEEVRLKYPTTVLVLLIGYNTQTQDASSLQFVWNRLLKPLGAEPEKFVHESFWDIDQTRSYIDAIFKLRAETLADPEEPMFMDQLGDELKDQLAIVCHLASYGHPKLLSSIAPGLINDTYWEDYFDEIDPETLNRAGKYLTSQMLTRVMRLAEVPSPDGFHLLGNSTRSNQSVVDPEMKDLFSGMLRTLEGSLTDIISPLSFQHMATQLYTQLAKFGSYFFLLPRP